MHEVMIQTNNLTKSYGSICAVNNVSLTVKRGSIVGLVGKNGAGKTTLIRILTGLVAPTSGTFQIMPDQERRDTSVAAIVEKPSIYLDMTAIDNLTAQAKLLGISPDGEFLLKTLELVGLANTNQKVKNYSLGMKQRLALAMTLVGKPELLILDEPTNGLDPQGIHDMRELFVTLNRDFGTTIVISSHILSELGKFATEFFFMDKGQLLKHATQEELAVLGEKRLRLTVADAEKAKAVLETLGRTEIISAETVEVFGELQPTQVLLELSKAGVVVSNIQNVGDDLESFFIGLIGGAK